ncbi:MAG: response regulator transcription factor [Elusimicrobiota bacterium]
MTSPAPRLRRPAATARILIVEDEKDLVRLIRRKLERCGYRVLSAGDAESALNLAREASPALILLDVVLPAMDGLTFLRQLRKESRIPVVLLSGRASDVDRILGLKAGADDYIVKPFSLDELVARIECHLRRRDHSGQA